VGGGGGGRSGFMDWVGSLPCYSPPPVQVRCGLSAVPSSLPSSSLLELLCTYPTLHHLSMPARVPAHMPPDAVTPPDQQLGAPLPLPSPLAGMGGPAQGTVDFGEGRLRHSATYVSRNSRKRSCTSTARWSSWRTGASVPPPAPLPAPVEAI
jgi:hypothetical protein